MAKSVHRRKSTARSSKVRKSSPKTKKVVRRKTKSASSKRKKRKTSKKRKSSGKNVMRGGSNEIKATDNREQILLKIQKYPESAVESYYNNNLCF